MNSARTAGACSFTSAVLARPGDYRNTWGFHRRVGREVWPADSVRQLDSCGRSRPSSTIRQPAAPTALGSPAVTGASPASRGTISLASAAARYEEVVARFSTYGTHGDVVARCSSRLIEKVDERRSRRRRGYPNASRSQPAQCVAVGTSSDAGNGEGGGAVEEIRESSLNAAAFSQDLLARSG